MGKFANFYSSKVVNGVKDRIYDATSFEEWIRPFFVSGVFNGSLQVLATQGMTVRIVPGYVNIGGKTKYFEDDTSITLDGSHATLNRIDNIVIRRSDVDRDFTIMVQKGNFSINPVAPEPIRLDNIYDLVIARIYINAASINILQENITDTRMISELCGWVASTVEEIDFNQITAQWTDYFENFKEDNLDEFINWFNSIKDILDEDTAGNLLNLINQLSIKVDSSFEEIDILNRRVDEIIMKTTFNHTLAVAGWVGTAVPFTYTIENSNIKSTSTIDVTFPADATKEQIESAQGANIVPGTQANGSFQLRAFGDKPTIDIPIVITIRN